MTIDDAALGRRIRELRLKQNMERQDLVDRAGVRMSHVRNLESGNSRPGMDALYRIAQALSVNVDELLCDSVVKSGWVYRKEIMETVKDCNEFEKRYLLYMLKMGRLLLKKDMDANVDVKQFFEDMGI